MALLVKPTGRPGLDITLTDHVPGSRREIRSAIAFVLLAWWPTKNHAFFEILGNIDCQLASRSPKHALSNDMALNHLGFKQKSRQLFMVVMVLDEDLTGFQVKFREVHCGKGDTIQRSVINQLQRKTIVHEIMMQAYEASMSSKVDNEGFRLSRKIPHFKLPMEF